VLVLGRCYSVLLKECMGSFSSSMSCIDELSNSTAVYDFESILDCSYYYRREITLRDLVFRWIPKRCVSIPSS